MALGGGPDGGIGAKGVLKKIPDPSFTGFGNIVDTGHN
jgi:hypothetical protein